MAGPRSPGPRPRGWWCPASSTPAAGNRAREDLDLVAVEARDPVLPTGAPTSRSARRRWAREPACQRAGLRARRHRGASMHPAGSEPRQCPGRGRPRPADAAERRALWWGSGSGTSRWMCGWLVLKTSSSGLRSSSSSFSPGRRPTISMGMSTPTGSPTAGSSARPDRRSGPAGPCRA